MINRRNTDVLWQPFCFSLPTIAPNWHVCVFAESRCGLHLIENDTSGTTIRIRLTAVPLGADFDEFDLRRFRVGEIYNVPTRLGSLLIIAGYAQLLTGGHQISQAADVGHIRFPKPKK